MVIPNTIDIESKQMTSNSPSCISMEDGDHVRCIENLHFRNRWVLITRPNSHTASEVKKSKYDDNFSPLYFGRCICTLIQFRTHRVHG